MRDGKGLALPLETRILRRVAFWARVVAVLTLLGPLLSVIDGLVTATVGQGVSSLLPVLVLTVPSVWLWQAARVLARCTTADEADVLRACRKLRNYFAMVAILIFAALVLCAVSIWISFGSSLAWT
jgi:hypothetical protein